ncbi:MAG: tRNA lysidine(34) synthetase TilS [Candidatus Limnocylindria bacterium]
MAATTTAFEAACRRLGVRDGIGIVLTVSGGPDSMAFLHLAHAAAPGHGWTLVVAHLDHGLRPESADDARFVADAAAALGLEAHLRRTDVAALAAERGEGIEEAGRQARYAFFDAVAESIGPDTLVMTAHTADDQAETVLLHLARGTGLAGLAGIAPRRGRIVRPLLDQRRAVLRRALDEAGIAYRLDPSNADPRFRRNRARAGLVPALEALHDGAVEALAALAARAADEDRALDAIAATELASRRSADGSIGWQPPPARAIGRRLLRLAAGPPAPSAERIEALVDALAARRGGRTIELGGGRRALVGSDRVRILLKG